MRGTMSTTDSVSVASDGSRFSLISASGLKIDASTNAGDGVFDDFYLDYDKAFVLENEKESYEGFTDCLALNGGDAFSRLVDQFGAFREFVIVVRNTQTGARIGGANFIAFLLRRSVNSSDTLLSMNLNYVFINPAFRRGGFFKQLVSDLPDIALRLFAAANPHDLQIKRSSSGSRHPNISRELIMFIEQNDPYRMSRADYERDTQFTGLDQFARIGIWQRLGAKIVDFSYAQPPLTSKQSADVNLVCGVLGVRSEMLDACLFRSHLERFFGISVLKGADPMQEPTAAQQLAELARMCADHEPVRLLGAGGLENAPSPMSTADNRPRSLREALRR